jgi:hypothetical protein
VGYGQHGQGRPEAVRARQAEPALITEASTQAELRREVSCFAAAARIKRRCKGGMSTNLLSHP